MSARSNPCIFAIPKATAGLVLAGVLLMAWGSVAQAQQTEEPPGDPQRPLAAGSQIALLPLRGDGAAPAARQDILRALRTAYRKLGYRVIAPENVAQRISEGSPTRSCLQPQARCDYPALVQSLEVDAVAVAAFWNRRDAPHQLVVRVVRADGAEGSAQQTVQPSDLDRVARAVAAAALADTERLGRVPVHIRTAPDGATITIDRRTQASAPAELELPPGQHLIMVSHPGYLTRSQFVQVPDTPDEPFVHEVQLQKTAQAPASGTSRAGDATAVTHRPPSSGTHQPSLWNYAAGAGLAAVAVPFLAYGIYTAATVGDCVDHDALRNCREEVTFGPKAGVSLGVGAAAALGSAYFFAFTPIAVEATERRVTLQLRGQF